VNRYKKSIIFPRCKLCPVSMLVLALGFFSSVDSRHLKRFHHSFIFTFIYSFIGSQFLDVRWPPSWQELSTCVFSDGCSFYSLYMPLFHVLLCIILSCSQWVVICAGTAVASSLMDKQGRKKLLIISFTGMVYLSRDVLFCIRCFQFPLDSCYVEFMLKMANSKTWAWIFRHHLQVI
jgi:hypothetical protein